ncbi:hypothetical protein BDP27DRAFT_246697 [Rhodocollybia butyracea]|uniref:Uncharacterized protein n=1 Tax=Rhodocollybia butyracea TaxID=206335 RepID=A0A9P5UCE5_9AGAR|nr:hypothetical protein BDP27DRAFT_246697 [Rhodocollybia butyracea]
MSSSTDNSTVISASQVDNVIVALTFDETRPDFIMLIWVVMLYGGYTVLLSLYAYLQVQQRGRKRYYQISVLILYMLATTALVLAILAYNQENLLLFAVVFAEINGNVGDALLFDPAVYHHFSVYNALFTAEAAVYVTANIIADALLLYRCYIVWGARKYVIIGPFLISIANAALALAAAALAQQNDETIIANTSLKAASAISTSFLAVNLFTNCLLTGLIAGRIWWISKATRQSLGADDDDNSLTSIVAIILESGSLYPVALAIGMGLNAANSVFSVEPILTVIVGMAPTLIMVRTDLDISIRNSPDEKRSEPSSDDGDNDVEADRSALGSTYELRPSEKNRRNPQPQEYDPWANFRHSFTGNGPQDAAPPAFSESQQGSSTMLISAGPPLQRNEKSSQNGGLFVLRPPVIE